MKMDCNWFNSNLEAYFSETLEESDVRRAREHLTACNNCCQQVQGLRDIDPMVHQLLRFRMSEARRAGVHRPAVRLLRPALLGTALAALVAGVLSLWDSTPDVTPPSLVAEQPAVPQPPPAPEVPEKKSSDSLPVERAKADETTDVDIPITAANESDPLPGTSDFAVIDEAGYSKTLDNYRGSVLIVGVWSSAQPESVGNLNRIYQTFGHRPEVRILGVAAQRRDKAEGATFQVVFNSGSQLMGLKTGEFLLLDQTGNRRLTGSLTNGTNTLLPRIKTQLDQLAEK